MEKRICPFCGKSIAAFLNRCPECREAMPDAGGAGSRSGSSASGRENIRRGLLWALLGSVAYYFATPNSTFTLPVAVPSFVTQALLPLVVLAGLALAVFGLFQKLRS
jgi:hypothetical protein